MNLVLGFSTTRVVTPVEKWLSWLPEDFSTFAPKDVQFFHTLRGLTGFLVWA